MTNFIGIKDLRSKEETIIYFKQLGKNITEEEIDALKNKQVEKSNGILSLNQLDYAVGGIYVDKRGFIHLGKLYVPEWIKISKNNGFINIPVTMQSEKDFLADDPSYLPFEIEDQVCYSKISQFKPGLALSIMCLIPTQVRLEAYDEEQKKFLEKVVKNTLFKDIKSIAAAAA